jgi:hypothetical protein
MIEIMVHKKGSGWRIKNTLTFSSEESRLGSVFALLSDDREEPCPLILHTVFSSPSLIPLLEENERPKLIFNDLKKRRRL